MKKKLNDSPFMRWTALVLVASAMFFAYMFVDVLSPLQTMLETQVGWSADTYGTFASSEYFLNVFVFFLIFAGIILDKMGVRFTAILSGAVMVIGGGIKLYAISPLFADSIRIPHIPFGERCAQLAPYILDAYNVGKDDLLILVNGYGINPVTIETALECQKRGVKVIAVTSTDYAEKLPKDFHGRHPSGKNLHEMFPVTLLTYMEYGDAILEMPGIASKIGPYSTFSNAFICNAMVIRACEFLVNEGIEPPIINSINVEGGLEKNQKLYAKYRPLIKWL